MPENHIDAIRPTNPGSKTPPLKRWKRRLLFLSAGLVTLGLLVGSYLGWQVYKAKNLAAKYAEEADKLAQQSSRHASVPSIPNTTDSPVSITPGITAPSNPNGTLSQTYSASYPAANTGRTDEPGFQPNSDLTVNPGTSNPIKNYQALMNPTYTQVLQTMENVKANTLAMQKLSLSVSAYKGIILASKSAFQTAQAYVQANPPQDAGQLRYYQDFLAGITLADRSMDVVLDGISSLNASSLYAARAMGKTARDQVVNAYQHLH